MKTYIFLALFFAVTNCFSQNETNTFESIYTLSIKGNIDIAGLPPHIAINATLKVIRSSKYCILIIMESSLENQILSSIARSENDGDTLFFDVVNKKVYSFSKKKCYWYTENTITPNQKDTIKNSDTVITLSNKLDKLISPTPTLKEMNYGITSYATKKFSFLYISSKQSTVSLITIFNRCKNFLYTNQKTEFAY